MVCPRVFSGSHSDVSFDSVWFHDDVSFQGATFGDPDHTTLTRFFKVTFGRNASFSAASFNSHTYLNACVVSNFFAFDSTPILCLDHVGHISVDCIPDVALQQAPRGLDAPWPTRHFDAAGTFDGAFISSELPIERSTVADVHHLNARISTWMTGSCFSEK